MQTDSLYGLCTLVCFYGLCQTRGYKSHWNPSTLESNRLYRCTYSKTITIFVRPIHCPVCVGVGCCILRWCAPLWVLRMRDKTNDTKEHNILMRVTLTIFNGMNAMVPCGSNFRTWPSIRTVHSDHSNQWKLHCVHSFTVYQLWLLMIKWNRHSGADSNSNRISKLRTALFLLATSTASMSLYWESSVIRRRSSR